MQKYNVAGWFEIYVNDISRAKKFYETVLQVQLQTLEVPGSEDLLMEAFPMSPDDLPGASGSLVQMEGMQAGGNSTIIYFSSMDCSVEEARVVDAGGEVFKTKMSIGDYGFISLCVDTEGNIFGIHSMN